MSVPQFTTENPDKADHTFVLERHDGITVNLDLAQAGVGNMPNLRLPEFDIPFEKVRFVIVIQPIGE